MSYQDPHSTPNPENPRHRAGDVAGASDNQETAREHLEELQDESAPSQRSPMLIVTLMIAILLVVLGIFAVIGGVVG